MFSFNLRMHEAENGGPINKDSAMLVEVDIVIFRNINWIRRKETNGNWNLSETIYTLA